MWHRIVTGPWKENCYVVCADDGTAVIIDPGDDFSEIESVVRAHSLHPRAVLNTHAHYDHIGAVCDVKDAFGILFYLNSADAKLLRAANFYRHLFLGEKTIRIPSVEHDLAGVTELSFGTLCIGVFSTPGHTAGSVCFAIDGVLFTGDTLMANTIGRTDLPGGDPVEILRSIESLYQLFPSETVICPGHGEALTLAETASINSHVRKVM